MTDLTTLGYRMVRRFLIYAFLFIGGLFLGHGDIVWGMLLAGAGFLIDGIWFATTYKEWQ